jgi:hypothetical protein
MRVRRSSNEARPYIARLSVFHPVPMAFDHSRTPWQRESGGDGVEVVAKEAGEALHGLRCVLLGLPDPPSSRYPCSGPTRAAKARARSQAG